MTYDLRLNIDKDLLDEQVKSLIQVRFSSSWYNPEGQKHIEGIVELIEEIQDQIDKATHAWKDISEYNDTDLTEPATIGKIK